MQELIGESEDVVINYLTQNNIKFRVVARDTTAYLVTQDFDPERLNLTVEKGFITKITSG